MSIRLPSGYRFAGMHCGIKPAKPDLALIVADTPTQGFGVYTQNLVRAACIDWNRKRTPMKSARGIIVNSGNANACTGERGREDNQSMATAVANQLSAEGKPTLSEQIFVLSTGVIGRPLPMPTVEQGIRDLVPKLGKTTSHFEDTARAILTTDKGPKFGSRELSLQQRTYHIAAMAKGAGMIGPNMATMLGLITTDLPIPLDQGQSILKKAVDGSFNRISVEGHTSTNDAVILLTPTPTADIHVSEDDLQAFQTSLSELCLELARKIPTDGEGAEHLIHIRIRGALSHDDADRIARTIAASNLVKTAVSGADPNWGRIVSAAGYAGVPVDVERTSLELNGFRVFENGTPNAFDAAQVSRSIRETPLTSIDLVVGQGEGHSEHWTSDLTVDYVRLNSEYTT